MLNLLEFSDFLRKWFEFENSVYRIGAYLVILIIIGAIVKLIEKAVTKRKRKTD